LVKWVIVLVVGVAVILIGSAGRIPFTDISLALSEETRLKAAEEHTPTLSRSEALSRVKTYLSEECANGPGYLLNKHRFDATWMRMPRTDDHHVRGMNEWTINDQSSGAMWRFYEDTGEIVTVLGNC
jgi:hypothetical protein|tara:strand:- start:153 stop:533 length:381 start_codon:yes stop_codon:yes gene_type:complete